MKINLFKLVISVAIPEIAGGIGSVFTIEAIPGWYSTLIRSPLTPPNWIFAPMWISLYFLMGISFYLIWMRNEKTGYLYLAYTLYLIQLALNVLWSFLFFGIHEILFGGIEIVFLWFFILASIIEFMKIDRRAAYLLFPYISWVTVATLLNFSLLWVNA